MRHHLTFTRSNEPLIARVEIESSEDSPNVVLENLKKAITDWVDNTNEGKEIYEDSSEDFNIGDLDHYWDDDTLEPYLIQYDVEIIEIDILSESVVDFDTQLVNR